MKSAILTILITLLAMSSWACEPGSYTGKMLEVESGQEHSMMIIVGWDGLVEEFSAGHPTDCSGSLMAGVLLGSGYVVGDSVFVDASGPNGSVALTGSCSDNIMVGSWNGSSRGCPKSGTWQASKVVSDDDGDGDDGDGGEDGGDGGNGGGGGGDGSGEGSDGGDEAAEDLDMAKKRAESGRDHPEHEASLSVSMDRKSLFVPSPARAKVVLRVSEEKVDWNHVEISPEIGQLRSIGLELLGSMISLKDQTLTLIIGWDAVTKIAEKGSLTVIFTYKSTTASFTIESVPASWTFCFVPTPPSMKMFERSVK